MIGLFNETGSAGGHKVKILCADLDMMYLGVCWDSLVHMKRLWLEVPKENTREWKEKGGLEEKGSPGKGSEREQLGK